jgi:ATP-binding cassette subfamily B protein/subfamily B ATP-binding cassette protein MsbA
VAASDRIFAVMDRAPAVADPPAPRILPRHSRDLVFEGVDFRYDPQQPVLSDIHLEVAFGETIAIVGANGCGKSTLVNLIPRFFDPTRGSVRLDGVDLRAVRQHDLRRQIGIVTQETLLFDDTITDNIRYGSPDASIEQVMAAARQAHAHEFIETKLTDGYNTMVGPGGQRLSGGQRQRIALARAILRDPALLILDEATSQIDLESEQLIHAALERFIQDRTALIITHRLTTLALADRILVLDHGRILDIGSHEQLLARCDLYRRLHQLELKQTA